MEIKEVSFSVRGFPAIDTWPLPTPQKGFCLESLLVCLTQQPWSANTNEKP